MLSSGGPETPDSMFGYRQEHRENPGSGGGPIGWIRFAASREHIASVPWSFEVQLLGRLSGPTPLDHS